MINLDKKVIWNKTRHVEVDKKLDNLKKKVDIISTKGLTKNLINKYCILNGAKYFSSDGLQNYLVFMSSRRIYWISKGASDSKIE